MNLVLSKTQPIKYAFMMLTLIFSVFLLTACQDNKSEIFESEVLTIELTDAKGDFNTYSVDILSLTLTKIDDTIVEVLPENTRVDFAQYVEMSEIFTTATVPSGVYKAATLTLDYSNAEIFVENEAGDNIQVTRIIDENDQDISILETKITLEDRNRLRIVPGVPAHLSLDFDLKVSNVVDFEIPESPVVTVSPVLNASLEPDANKSHRARGPLKKVNVEKSQFDLIIRPFNKKLNHKKERFGNLRVNTDEETKFEINGEMLVGNDGLATMDTLNRLTAVIVLGEVSLRPRRFHATEVYAGSSVPNGALDVVKGTVMSRFENTIIVKGATLIRIDGKVNFRNEVTVYIDTTTQVKRQHEREEVSIDDISVGQKVTVFGNYDDNTEDAPFLDATNGVVRLLITTVSGVVVGEKDEAESALFSLDLSNINRHRASAFDFSGTGIDSENDADPMSYEIETSTLGLENFPLNSAINVKGFVNSFGQAPADFLAKSINNKQKTLSAKMQTNWTPASNNAFSLISNSKITLDFSEAGRFHYISHGRRRVDLTKLDTDFSLVPAIGAASVSYVIIIKNDSKHIHTNFENFSEEVATLIGEGNAVRLIQAKGRFNIVNGELAATRIRVKFNQ